MANLAEITRSAALEWLRRNTTMAIPESPVDGVLTPSTELFIIKFGEIVMLPAGVTSESIGGASQSFATDKTALLKQYARELFGDDAVAGDVTFTPAVGRWK